MDAVVVQRGHWCPVPGLSGGLGLEVSQLGGVKGAGQHGGELAVAHIALGVKPAVADSLHDAPFRALGHVLVGPVAGRDVGEVGNAGAGRGRGSRRWGRRGCRSRRRGGRRGGCLPRCEMLLHAGAVQGVEHRGGVVGDIPHDLTVIIDGLAVRQGAFGGLVLLRSSVRAVVEVIQGVIDDMSTLAVPQQIAAVQSGGGQHRGSGAGGLGDLRAPALSGGLVHPVVVHIAVAVSALAVIVIAEHVAVPGLGQPADGGSGGVGPYGPGKLKQVAVAAPGVVALAPEPARPGVGVVLAERHAPGVGVSVVDGHDAAVLVHKDELVEGVAHIAVGLVHHVVIGVGDSHAVLLHGDGHVGLVVQPVAGGIHLVAGADIEVAAVLVAAQGARIEGVYGVGPSEAGLTQPLPVLGVFDYPDDFLAVVLLHVVLAENQEVVVPSGVKAAPDGQLHGDGAAGPEDKGTAVVLHDDLLLALGGLQFSVHIGVAPNAAGQLHPGQTAVWIFVQIGFDGGGPCGVVLPVFVGGYCWLGVRCENGGRQPQA